MMSIVITSNDQDEFQDRLNKELSNWSYDNVEIQYRMSTGDRYEWYTALVIIKDEEENYFSKCPSK